MIYGLGTDIIEINRIAKACEKESFLKKGFTEKEIEQFREVQFRTETIAGVFAAKEAVSKSLKTGFRGFSPIDIEILKDELGCPHVFLKGKAEDIACEKKLAIQVSISHSKEFAVAYAIAEER